MHNVANTIIFVWNKMDDTQPCYLNVEKKLVLPQATTWDFESWQNPKDSM